MEKKYTTIIVILLIVIVGLSGFIVYDKFSDNDIEDSSNNEVAEEDDSSSEVHALSGRFAFKDNNVIYSADYSDFLENGVKEVIADDVDRLANMVMFNYNIYYIDNTGKLVVYNPYKKSSIEYTFEGFEARVMCHEYDHLDGILYKDKAKEMFDESQVGYEE